MEKTIGGRRMKCETCGTEYKEIPENSLIDAIFDDYGNRYRVVGIYMCRKCRENDEKEHKFDYADDYLDDGIINDEDLWEEDE